MFISPIFHSYKIIHIFDGRIITKRLFFHDQKDVIEKDNYMLNWMKEYNNRLTTTSYNDMNDIEYKDTNRLIHVANLISSNQIDIFLKNDEINNLVILLSKFKGSVKLCMHLRNNLKYSKNNNTNSIVPIKKIDKILKNWLHIVFCTDSGR